MLNTRLTETEMINQMNSINVSTILTTQPFHLSDFNVIHISEIEQYSKRINNQTCNYDRIASIMFTSGTTGPQKAVPQTFKNHYASAIGCKESLGYDETTKWLSVLPIYHISGLSVLLRSIIEGFTVRILEKYNTQTMLSIIKEEGPTHISLVPQTLKWLMDAGLNQPFSIEKILLGGAKLSTTLMKPKLSVTDIQFIWNDRNVFSISNCYPRCLHNGMILSANQVKTLMYVLNIQIVKVMANFS